MDSNGNVGIGVTNPTYKLHVVGSIYADNLNMSYFNASGGQKAGGIFFTGDIPAAQWQIAIIGDYKLGFNINNTGTDGYSPSYTPVITFGNTGTINCGAITLNNTNVPLYLYNFGPTNYSAIYADAGGTMTFATGISGVGTRMTIAPAGSVNVVGGLTGAEVYTNNWFHINNNNCGLYWEGLGRGISSPEQGGNSYGNICSYGSGRNGWSGYGMTSRHTIMSDGNTVGIHDNSKSWCISFDTDKNGNIPVSLTVAGVNVSARITALEARMTALENKVNGFATSFTTTTLMAQYMDIGVPGNSFRMIDYDSRSYLQFTNLPFSTGRCNGRGNAWAGCNLWNALTG